MRNVNYFPVWIKAVLLFVVIYLLWIMAGGPEINSLALKIGISLGLMLLLTGAIMLMVYSRRDEVAEMRFKSRQCVDCGCPLPASAGNCPECGKPV